MRSWNYNPSLVYPVSSWATGTPLSLSRMGCRQRVRGSTSGFGCLVAALAGLVRGGRVRAEQRERSSMRMVHETAVIRERPRRTRPLES